MQLFYAGLALSCILGLGVDGKAAHHAASRTQEPSTTTVTVPTEPPTTVEPTNTTSDDNSTLAVIRITDYHYFDWPRIGYQIFMQKMIDALKTLKFFMGLDPMVLKITRTFIFTNDTDADYDDNNNSTTTNDTSSPIQADQSVETNTESPFKVNSVELETSKEDKISKPQIKNESTENSQGSKDDIKKTKTESGFFSSISKAVAGFYHSLTDWF